MSKIAEKKALEVYPPTPLNVSLVDYNSFKRTFYAKGYDQAMQDFLEKAEKYLVPHIQSILLGDMHDTSMFLQDFQNYIKK